MNYSAKAKKTSDDHYHVNNDNDDDAEIFSIPGLLSHYGPGHHDYTDTNMALSKVTIPSYIMIIINIIIIIIMNIIITIIMVI